MVPVEFYPPSPPALPGFTAAPPSYRRNAWIAVGGLLTFVGLYLSLIGYFAWFLYKMVGHAVLYGGNWIPTILVSLPAAFFLAFLVSGLLMVKRGGPQGQIEVTRVGQPELFDFLDALVLETGAPRPAKVFISPGVNASVYYDLSFRNFIFPSQKNLEIGMGLLNALTLDELKAVLGHELGHFAQRTMAVGRWVYIAQQIAGHVVASRGIFDRFLMGVSNFDIRIGWIGWIFRIFVWALRALLDIAFRILVLAQRALGREMEFQADKVAVSVAGSDSLVHALHRLGPAEEAWDEALSFAMDERRAGRLVTDIFELQTAALTHLRRILDDPCYGQTPLRPENAAQHRIFELELAQPPRMWTTHPSNREREERAKAVYLPSSLDNRSGWVLLRAVESLKRGVTNHIFDDLPPIGKTEPAEGTFLERFAQRFNRAALDPKYRGIYLGRLIAARAKTAAELIGPLPEGNREKLAQALTQLYPQALRAEMASYRERRQETALLEGLAEGFLTAPGGVIRYRGQEFGRRDLPNLIETVKAEKSAVEQRILAHDRACRATHLALARRAGNGWPEHLESLVKLLHYGTHMLRGLVDAHTYLHHVLELVLADGRVSDQDRRQVLQSASDLDIFMRNLWAQKPSLVLPGNLEKYFVAGGGWTALSESFTLGTPNEENLGVWLENIEGWAYGARNDLVTLLDACLDTLLAVEVRLALWAEDGEIPELAPEPAVVPDKYPICLVGEERERQTKLSWWDRFISADGFIPGTLRTGAALGLLLPAFILGAQVGSAKVHLVNGLGTAVIVRLDDQQFALEPGEIKTNISLPPRRSVQVEAYHQKGLIERFEAPVSGFGEVVYNIAQAAPLNTWIISYGTPNPPVKMSTSVDRWRVYKEDYVLREPRKSISTKGPSTRKLLAAALEESPWHQLGHLGRQEDKDRMLRNHLRYDDANSRGIAGWAFLAKDFPGAVDILLERADNDSQVVFERALQDLLPTAALDERCADILRRSEAAPLDGGLKYLAIRCQYPEQARDARWLVAWEDNQQDPWLSWVVAGNLAGSGRWQESLAACGRSLADPALMPLRRSNAIECLRVFMATEVLGIKAETPPFLGLEAVKEVQEWLRYVNGQADDGTPRMRIFEDLSRGHLQSAVSRARPTPMLADILLQVACSEGAPEALVAEALQLPPDKVSPQFLWLWVALLARAEKLQIFPENWLKESGLAAVEATKIEALLKNRVTEPAPWENLAKNQDISTRGKIWVMGLLFLGEQAPQLWRKEARAFLWEFERPYLSPGR